MWLSGGCYDTDLALEFGTQNSMRNLRSLPLGHPGCWYGAGPVAEWVLLAYVTEHTNVNVGCGSFVQSSFVFRCPKTVGAPK